MLVILVIGPFPNVYSIGYKARFIGAFLGTSIITYFVEYIRESTQKLLHDKNRELENSLKELDLKEIKLRENETYYRTLFNKSNDAIFLLEDNKFIDCNIKALSLFGCSKDDIIGKSPVFFSPVNQPDGTLSAQIIQKHVNIALQGEHQFFEWVHKRLDDSEFYAEISLDKIEISDRNIILASIRNICERKKAENSLILAKEKAEKSLHLKSEFLAQVSHEIRTPINTIMNFTYLLKNEFENKVSEENIGSFNSIENAATRLLRTIDLILNLSDIESGTYEPKMETISLAEKIIIPSTNELRQTAENKNLKLLIENRIEAKDYIFVDPYTVYQTIINLIDNAIKYTKTGKITVILREESNYIYVDIQDTGIGISEKYIPYLFDKFSQEDVGYTRKFEGNGLGLALVKQYCEINNINIFVKSKKDIGTTFTLKIPTAA